MGYLSVAMFFFLSGYGITESYKKKGDSYVDGFPRKHILPFYLNCILLIAIYAVVKFLILGNPFTPQTFFQSFAWGGTIIYGGWYLQAILLVYLEIYLTFKLAKKDSLKPLLFFLFLIAYIILCVATNMSVTAYESIFAVLVGLFWSLYKEAIEREMNKRYWLYLFGSLVAFSVLFVCPILSIPKTVGVIIKALSALVFVWFVVLLLMKTPLNFKIIDILGVYSFEIYVMQGISIALLRNGIVYIENNLLFVGACILLTAVLSVAMHPVFKFINYSLKGKGNGNKI